MPSFFRQWAVVIVTIGISLGVAVPAYATPIYYKCNHTEHCGSLKQTACYEPGMGFYIIIDEDKKVYALIANEKWESQNVNFSSKHPDLSTFVIGGALGEVALLSVDTDWNYVLSEQFIGLGDGLNWEVSRGTCELESQ